LFQRLCFRELCPDLLISKRWLANRFVWLQRRQSHPSLFQRLCFRELCPDLLISKRWLANRW